MLCCVQFLKVLAVDQKSDIGMEGFKLEQNLRQESCLALLRIRLVTAQILRYSIKFEAK